MRNSTGWTSFGSFQPQTTACSTMPSATAANAIVGSRSMRPMTAAASAGSSSDGPSTVPSESPTIPARRNTARNASNDANIHTTECTRRTGMPSSAARSASSAQARMATPRRVRRNSASPTNASGITTSATTSFPPKVNGSTVNERSNGAGKLCGGRPTPNHPGRSNPSPASSWARPMVATVRISRGDRKNRRITSSSTAAPRTTAAAIPTTKATTQLAPLVTTSSTASDAGAAPRSPWAKLRMRFARYTRASPSARRALRPPRMAPCTTIPAGGPHSSCTSDEEGDRPEDPGERAPGPT